MAANTNDPEFRASMRVPATVANRAFVYVVGEETRLAFGEAFGGDPNTTNYHTAINLSSDDAWALAHTIIRLISENDRKALDRKNPFLPLTMPPPKSGADNG